MLNFDNNMNKCNKKYLIKYFHSHLQTRVQQLLQQNRELMETIASLGGYVEPDKYITLGSGAGITLAPQVITDF